jgi:hypothetical protein
MPIATGRKASPPGGALEAIYTGDVEGTTWEVVHWFMTTGSADTDPTDFELVLNVLYELFAVNVIAPCCSESLHFREVWGHLFSADRERLRHRKAGEALGSVPGDLAPAQVATLIDWTCRDGRRGGKARSYIPGVPMANLADNAHFESDARDAMDLGARTYLADVVAAEAGPLRVTYMAQMSFVDGHAYRTVPTAFPVVGAYVRSVPATQRRRIEREA